MLTTDISQMQHYQNMLGQQQQLGPAGGKQYSQIYQTQAEDPNQVQEQRTPIQGMPRSDIWKNLTFDPSWLQQTQGDPNQLQAQETQIPGIRDLSQGPIRNALSSHLIQYQNPAEAQGAQVLPKPYEPQQDSSRMHPQGNPDAYQLGLGSLFAGGSFGGPRQPQQAFESQFSELQNQMGGFGEQFTGLETSLGGLGESITAITDRLDSIEQGIKGLKTDDTSQAYTRMNWQPFSEWGKRRT
jgi:hypothetical protein